MKKRLWQLFTVVGAITCVLLMLTLTVLAVRSCGDDVPHKVVLELRLQRPVGETDAAHPLSRLTGSDGATVLATIEALQAAKTDDRVVGVFAWVGASEHGIARTQELRDAIVDFRASGKFAIAFAETFGELAPANEGYYLATAFDEVWLQPTGGVGLTGLRAETMFLEGALELAEIGARGDRRREYKNAYNMFTERAYTDAHREATAAILEDTYAQIVRGIAERRGLGEDEVRAIVDRGPLLGPEALEAKLVDGLGYHDEVIAAVKQRAGEDAELLYLEKYRERVGSPFVGGDKKLALIYGVGGVAQGESKVDPIFGGETMGATTVAGAFRQAIDDEDVAAIVFRVDSPGGSAVASDTIWREVERAKRAGKPVVVSMGNVAGSGGYYVACAANKIVAQPGTITGSIGVFGGKPMLRNTWAKFGVTWDSIDTATNAAFFSELQDYDPAEWARLQAWLDWVYEEFKSRVAAGRGLDADAVEAVAKGRIWTGERAVGLGLVDELGGLTTAIRLAKQEAGLAADASIELAVFPESLGMFDKLIGEGPDSSEARTAAQVELGLHGLADELARLRPLVQRLAAATDAEANVLAMEPPPLR